MSTTPRIHVAADLDLEVGGIRARLEGEGADLILRTDRPYALWRELRSGDHGSLVGAVGETVAGTGVTVAVTGPYGRLATAGAVRSRLGRLLFGTWAVRPAPVPVLVGLAAGGVALVGAVAAVHALRRDA